MRIPTWFVMAWVVVVGVIAVGGSLFAYTFVRDRAAELDEVLELPDPPQIGHSSGDETATDGTTGAETASTLATPEPTLPRATDSAPGGEGAVTPAAPEASIGEQAEMTAAPEMDVTITPLQDPKRVNILLLGIDQRAGETGPFRTDTIILLSLDPVGKTSAMLSIPRDLWVTMPSLGKSDRINNANVLGEGINYPGGGGPAYAAMAVENLLGLNKIDYYMLINFEVFYTVVDVLGTVEVCPENEIYDDKYPDGSYGYITVHFPAGCQQLDSEKLLQYARTRHSDSDIGRSARQQEVILSVREKILSTGGIANLLPEAMKLWRAVQENVVTNMTFDNMLSIAWTAEKVEPQNIRQAQITFEEVFIGQDSEGTDILTPISSDIQLLMEDLFRPPNTPSRRAQPASE